MDFSYGESFTVEPAEAYERLMHDAMDGDHTLFARADSVERSWEVVQPILGELPPVHLYTAGSWGPREADDADRAAALAPALTRELDRRGRPGRGSGAHFPRGCAAHGRAGRREHAAPLLRTPRRDRLPLGRGRCLLRRRTLRPAGRTRTRTTAWRGRRCSAGCRRACIACPARPATRRPTRPSSGRSSARRCRLRPRRPRPGRGRSHRLPLPGGPARSRSGERWVARVERPDHARLTLTLPVLSAARVALFLVTGAAKAGALGKLMAGADIPASRVAARSGWWWSRTRRRRPGREQRRSARRREGVAGGSRIQGREGRACSGRREQVTRPDSRWTTRPTTP